MRIRYFAAAAAAAGVRDETVHLARIAADGGTLDALVRHLAAEHPAPSARNAPTLARVLERSSLLVNGVSAKNPRKPLADSDEVDVLPPFAGG